MKKFPWKFVVRLVLGAVLVVLIFNQTHSPWLALLCLLLLIDSELGNLVNKEQALLNGAIAKTLQSHSRSMDDLGKMYGSQGQAINALYKKFHLNLVEIGGKLVAKQISPPVNVLHFHKKGDK